MSRDIVTLRSTVYPLLMRFTLLRGTCLAGAGALFLLASGAFLSPDHLKTWGLAIFLVSVALIAWGLLPYRRMRNLENSPYKLVVDDEGTMTFTAKGKIVFMMPVSQVDRADYIEEDRKYGIVITLKEPCPGHDIFLPYFSKRSCSELSDTLASLSEIQHSRV